jgi:large subunit ribosomal protein L22
MEVRAIAKSVRISPRKIRLVADAIRNLSIDEALQLLEAAEKRAAGPLTKTINSAVANAINNAKLERANLTIGSIQINEGQPLKRFHPSTRGRIHPYKKRGSHIIVVLKEKPGAAVLATPASAKASASVKTTADKTAGKSVSEKADAAVEAAMYGGKEEKKDGVKAFASRFTGKKDEKKGKK